MVFEELEFIELLQVGDFLGNGSIEVVVREIQEAQLCEIGDEKRDFECDFDDHTCRIVAGDSIPVARRIGRV